MKLLMLGLGACLVLAGMFGLYRGIALHSVVSGGVEQLEAARPTLLAACGPATAGAPVAMLDEVSRYGCRDAMASGGSIDVACGPVSAGSPTQASAVLGEQAHSACESVVHAQLPSLLMADSDANAYDGWWQGALCVGFVLALLGLGLAAAGIRRK